MTCGKSCRHAQRPLYSLAELKTQPSKTENQARRKTSIPENIPHFPAKDYHLRALRPALSPGRRSSSSLQAQQQRIFNLCHDKENHHGQRTTAQDQGSKEAQEATGTRQALSKRALPTGR